MSSGVYNGFKKELMNGSHHLVADLINVKLLNNTHAFAPANTVYTNVSANELPTAGGYTAKGAEIATRTVTQNNSMNQGVFDGDNVSWVTATFTAYHAVIYNDTSTGDMLIASIDFGGAQQVTAGTFTIEWSASGILTIS